MKKNKKKVAKKIVIAPGNTQAKQFFAQLEARKAEIISRIKASTSAKRIAPTK